MTAETAQALTALDIIFFTGFFLLQSWGLYMINKKFGEKHAWLSWLPVAQIYSFFTASKASVMNYLAIPAIIGLSILGLIGLGIVGIVPFTLVAILYPLFIIYTLVLSIRFYHKISVRCGRGGWSTFGLIMVPFIMLPVIGYKLETSENIKREEITEL